MKKYCEKLKQLTKAEDVWVVLKYQSQTSGFKWILVILPGLTIEPGSHIDGLGREGAGEVWQAGRKMLHHGCARALGSPV